MVFAVMPSSFVFRDWVYGAVRWLISPLMISNGVQELFERNIFVRHRRPVGAALNGSAIGAIIRRGFQRTGLKVPSCGSHILRHTVATHMIQQGVSIKEIADILRHKSIDTTVIYTKVDIPMLSEVALPWPDERGES